LFLKKNKTIREGQGKEGEQRRGVTYLDYEEGGKGGRPLKAAGLGRRRSGFLRAGPAELVAGEAVKADAGFGGFERQLPVQLGGHPHHYFLITGRYTIGPRSTAPISQWAPTIRG